MNLKIWKFNTPLQLFGSFLWWLAETKNIKWLSKFAPTIFGWMIGAKKQRIR